MRFDTLEASRPRISDSNARGEVSMGINCMNLVEMVGVAPTGQLAPLLLYRQLSPSTRLHVLSLAASAS